MGILGSGLGLVLSVLAACCRICWRCLRLILIPSNSFWHVYSLVIISGLLLPSPYYFLGKFESERAEQRLEVRLHQNNESQNQQHRETRNDVGRLENKIDDLAREVRSGSNRSVVAGSPKAHAPERIVQTPHRKLSPSPQAQFDRLFGPAINRNQEIANQKAKAPKAANVRCVSSCYGWGDDLDTGWDDEIRTANRPAPISTADIVVIGDGDKSFRW